MKNSFNALRVRFYSFFVLFVLALFSVVTITSIQLQQSVVSIAVSIAGLPILERAMSFIDGDKYERLVETLDPNDPFFIETQAKFKELKKEMQVEFLYTMAIDSDGNHLFIFDGEEPDSEFASYLGEIEDISEYDISFLKTYETGIPQYTRLMSEYTVWGRLVSVYMPIFNSNDEIVGVVGVDFEGNELYDTIMSRLWQLIIIAVGLSIIGVFFFFFLMRDLAGQNKNIKQRDSLLSAVNNAITYLLQADKDEFNDALRESMGLMAKTINVDRAYIWKNHEKNKKLYCTLIYEWTENAAPQQSDDFEITLSYDDDFPRWKEKFLRRECINEIAGDVSGSEQAFLSSQGIVSLLTVPIYLRNEFWGFVGFDDFHNKRVFTENEESILRSGSLLIAYALLRHDMTQMLETALQDANAASVAKGNFLSNMSHEMRTPMNAIIGMTAIGKKANDIDGKNHALNKIEEASSHLLGVINDILDMSKIEADKMELISTPYNIEKMIHKVLNVSMMRAEEKLQKIEVSIDSQIPKYVIGDDQRLAQVLTNLLSNAVKFTPDKGEIKLNVFLNGEAGNYCELRFEVVDNGIGISPEKQHKLFDAFEQAEDVTHRKYGGTGLGLSISKRIVEMMNGRIWVESELGKGAKFIFTILLERNKDADDMPDGYDDQSNEDPGSTLRKTFKGKRLLLAEDVEINREIVVSLLEDSGLSIDCAENGKEAIDMIFADPEKYDIIFMDLQMPVMDGLEASRIIRTLPPRKKGRLPVIAMTANVFKEDIEACLEAGMDDHLGKPLDTERIYEKMNKYL